MFARSLLEKTPLLEILFVILWNSGFIGAEFGLPNAGPFTLLFWRYLALSFLLALWLTLSGRWRWPGRRKAARMSVVGVLAHGVWLACALVALDWNVPAGIVALITALQPLFTAAFSGAALGERTEPRQWAGLLLGFLGVVIAVQARIILDSGASAFAYMIPFGCVASMTLAGLLQRRWTRHRSGKELALDTSLFYQSGAATAALLIPAWLFEDFATQWTASFTGTMFWLVVAVSLGAYWAMWRLLARREAALVSSLFYFSPPVTMLMSWAAFGDVLLPTDLWGMAVAGVGVALVFRIRPRLALSRVWGALARSS